ncbi:MAG: N-terminal phage integrase SAM-like domain-containing protein [Actinomycetota bacterium]|nr:N-terminal phage integrase SAM-like domain-containing protein [Actinomycetota bacterium]
MARTRLTLASYLRDEWLPATAPPRVGYKTWRERRDTFERYVMPHLGTAELQKVSAA